MKADSRHHIITAADVRRAKGSIEISDNTIVTPSARDLAASLGIQLIPALPPSSAAIAGAASNKEIQEPKPLPQPLSVFIEHTNLSPAASREDIARLCEEALTHHFTVVCVSPVRIPDAADYLKDSGVSICSVVGFPAGTHDKALKAAEAAVCVQQGAAEIDMVANTGLLHDGCIDLYHADIQAVRSAIGSSAILKVIIEAPLLCPDDIVRAATAAASAGADCVKTSTGVYAKARVEDVVLLRQALPPNIKIKAAGGIRTAEFARALIAAGADRLGTSASIAIVSSDREPSGSA